MTEQDLSRGSGTALWRQIAERLEQSIRSGERRPGEKLPTEHQMADDFGVNRHTVRRAVASLEEIGLIRIEQGRGTFVQEDMLDYRVKSRTRFSENVLLARREPGGTLLSVREAAAEDSVAKALDLRKGSLVWVIERLGEANGRPISHSLHYFAKARFPEFDSVITVTGSITKALERLGIADYTRKSTRVTARVARAADSRNLQQPPNKPILVTEGINVDHLGRPLEYSIAHWASERVQILFEPGNDPPIEP